MILNQFFTTLEGMKSRFFVLSFSLLLLGVAHGQNTNISEGSVFDGEPFMACNPQNSSHLVIAWMSFERPGKLAIKTRISKDGGRTWSNKQSLPHADSRFTSADPCLTFDHEGHVFLSYIDHQPPLNKGSIYVRESEDGGKSWGNANEVMGINDDPGKKAIDRPWMVIDRSDGPNQGNVYITSMNASGAKSPFHPYFHHSENNGKSWEEWQYLDTVNWLAGSTIAQPMPSPAVSADGTLYAAYPSYKPSQNPFPAYILATSNDGGQSFTYQKITNARNTIRDSFAKKGSLLKADPANKDHLAFFYLAKPDGDADIFLAESYDGGNTWNDQQRVNDDAIGNNRMQDLVWADFNQSGDLFVAWRDRRNADKSGYKTSSEIYGAVKWQDSNSFEPNIRLSNKSVQYDSILAKAGNDFMNVQFVNDTVHVVWGDTREASLNIWYKRQALKSNHSSGVKDLTNNEKGKNINLSPNPACDVVSINVSQDAIIDKVVLINPAGRKVLSKHNPSKAPELKIDQLAEGIYGLIVLTQNQVYRKPLIIQN